MCIIKYISIDSDQSQTKTLDSATKKKIFTNLSQNFENIIKYKVYVHLKKIAVRL